MLQVNSTLANAKVVRTGGRRSGDQRKRPGDAASTSAEMRSRAAPSPVTLLRAKRLSYPFQRDLFETKKAQDDPLIRIVAFVALVIDFCFSTA